MMTPIQSRAEISNIERIPKVTEVMSRKLHFIPPESTILEALEFFDKKSVNAAPVLNEDNKLIGYISETDCIRCFSNCLFYNELIELPIKKIMKKDVIVVPESYDLFDAENIFYLNKIRSAPVVDKKGEVIGLLNNDLLLKAFMNLFNDILKTKKKLKTPFVLDLATRLKSLANR